MPKTNDDTEILALLNLVLTLQFSKQSRNPPIYDDQSKTEIHLAKKTDLGGSDIKMTIQYKCKHNLISATQCALAEYRLNGYFTNFVILALPGLGLRAIVLLK